MKKLIDIQIRSRGGARVFKSKTPWAAISISTDPDEFPVLNEENRIGLLPLSFWDIGGTLLPNESFGSDEFINDRLFSKIQAKQILEFVYNTLPEIDTLLIHCEMGLCRSPAVGAAISHVLWGAETEKVYFNRFDPNRFVYRTILDVHYESLEKAE